tara:strand:+ start:991 stop:1893 length:903 start_codon:yes stop_codon:yes gene_type:complete
MIKHWLNAFRLRTLPLAFSAVITGTALAVDLGMFDWIIFTLALTTTLFLQILSNLANDYGDAEKGTDNENRIGPKRSIQSGVISMTQMKKAIVFFICLSLCSGLFLVLYATRMISFWYPLIFIMVGVFSIIAAIKYTAGKGAYGYKGLGDIFVFVFFGLVGVIGNAVLQVHCFNFNMILPAISIGCFSAAVLNLNNMRDWKNDKDSKKNTLVVKVGLLKAKRYHFIILIIGMTSSIAYALQQKFKLIDLIFILAFIPILLHLKTINKIINTPAQFDPELKKVALSTFLFSIFFLMSTIVR